MPACDADGALIAQPLTAAAFAPFGTVIAAPAGRGEWINEGTAERFELLADLQAFITDGEQGICLAPGTWHHGLLAVDAGDFVVVERRGDLVDNEIHTLASPRRLVLPA